MTFTFDNTIPAANNDPSADQPDLLINNQSIASILDVDHIGFNQTSGGTHKQINFSSQNVPGAVADPAAIEFTTAGTVAVHPQLYYKNSQGTFPLSSIRAFGSFTLGATPAYVANSTFNVTGVVGYTPSSPLWTYTVTLNANTVNNNTPVLIIPPASAGFVSAYGFAGGVITFIYNNNATPPSSANVQHFLVLQM